MILNLLVVAFVLAMAYWWSGQGLFSSFLHLLITIVAAGLAFAVWEPLTVGFLLERMPEYAWGVGLLAPFGLLLIILRTLSDKMIPGNVNFHNIVDAIGGGILGFFTGVLTAGLLVIGLQYAGVTELIGYQPWRLDAQGRPVMDGGLWIPADRVAGNFFTGLSGGVFYSAQPLAVYHPELAREAAFFAVTPQTGARRSVREQNVSVTDYLAPETLPSDLTLQLPPGSRDQTLIVGTEIMQPAFDRDTTFRIAQSQIALAYKTGPGNPDELDLAYPVAYIQRGEVAKLTEGTFAYSKPAVQTETFHWVFQVPEGAEPMYLWVKGLRLDLPERAQVDPALLQSLIQPQANQTQPTEEEGGLFDDQAEMSPTQGLPGGAAGELAEATDRLPFSINRNRIMGVDTRENGIYAGQATVSNNRERMGQTLAINSIWHPETTGIVQVRLDQERARSMYGQVMNFATLNAAAPTLVDAAGDKYLPIGYLHTDGSSLKFNIRPGGPIRSLNQAEFGQLPKDQQLVLIYEVAKGARLTRFELGRQQQDLDLTVR